MNVTPLLALAGLGTIGLLATRLPRLPWPHATRLDRILAGGALFVLAGIVLGPGIDLLTRPVVDALAPVSALAIGWIGAVLGAQFEWRYVRRIPRSTWLLAGLSATAAFVVVLLGAWLLARAIPALARAWTPRLPAVLTLAAVAAASGPGAVTRLARSVGARRSVVRLLGRTATLQTAYSAVAFSIPVALYRPRPVLAWAGGVGGGILTGVAFLLLTRAWPDRVDTAFALVATLLLGAGVGYAAGLSPFVMCATATALAVNTAPGRHAIREALVRWQSAVAGIVLIVAGAVLALPTPWILVAALLLVALRAGAAWAANQGARRLRVAGVARIPADLGLATAAHGVAAVALGLNFLLVSGDRAAGAGGPLLTTIVLAVAIAHAAARPLMQRALVTTRAGSDASTEPTR